MKLCVELLVCDRTSQFAGVNVLTCPLRASLLLLLLLLLLLVVVVVHITVASVRTRTLRRRSARPSTNHHRYTAALPTRSRLPSLHYLPIEAPRSTTSQEQALNAGSSRVAECPNQKVSKHDFGLFPVIGAACRCYQSTRTV